MGCVRLATHLETKVLTQTADGCSHCGGSGCADCVRATSDGLAAVLAVPDTDSNALHRRLHGQA